MSRTEMFKINKDGTWTEHAEYRNSYGWAAFVWGALVRKYEITKMREMPHRFGSVDSEICKVIAGFDPGPDSFGPSMDWNFLWCAHQARVKEPDSISGKLPLLAFHPWEENVLWATYDRYIVEAKDFETFASSLEVFEEAFLCGPHHAAAPRNVCHLKAMAHGIRRLMEEDPEAVGICWYPMSVSENYWVIGYDEDADEEIRYNFSTGTDHKVVSVKPHRLSVVTRR